MGSSSSQNSDTNAINPITNQEATEGRCTIASELPVSVLRQTKDPPSTVSKSTKNTETLNMSADQEKLPEKLENIKINNKYINIVLLGHTGVGKSTLINSVANYLTYNKLDVAVRNDPIILIPSTFKIKDKHNTLHEVTFGSEDGNEFLEYGVSATQDVKTYVFPIWNGSTLIRLIDTPGMGDTRGIRQDNKNSENILSYIGELHELHAICLLFKPNESRSTVYFEYCMSQILSRLDKSASKNIIFIFTNTRGTDYSPGETMSVLKKTVDRIRQKPPFVEIPINRNIFCFENEAFRYLAGLSKNLKFDQSYNQIMIESWRKSSEECWKMIKYIVGDANNPPLNPHFVKNTNAVNEARRMITRLTQPLAEISQLINHNVFLLQRHEENLNMENNTIEQLKKKLYMPVVTVEAIKLTQPTTVCASKKCAEIHKVGGINNWHYKQRCHEPCYLKNVPEDLLGCPELAHCAAMSNEKCKMCSCSFSVHMHRYSLTQLKSDQIIDDNIQKNIGSKEKVLKNVKQLINNMYSKKAELDYEHKVIINCCAKFAHFLQNNAITPFSDSYKKYIEYLIEREESLGNNCNQNTVDYLKSLLLEYEEEKKTFDNALQSNNRSNNSHLIITPKSINESIQALYNLKHNGKKIKELYECQKTARRSEHAHTEYVHKSRSKDRQTNNRKREKSQSKPKKGPKNTYTENKKSRSPAPPYAEQTERRPRPDSSSNQPPEYARDSHYNYAGPHDQPGQGFASLPPNYSSHGYAYPPHGPNYGPPPYGTDYGPPSYDPNYGPPPYGPNYGPPPHGPNYGPPPHGPNYSQAPPGPHYPPYGHNYSFYSKNYYSFKGTNPPNDHYGGDNHQHGSHEQNNNPKPRGSRGRRGRGGVKKNCHKNPKKNYNQSDSSDSSE